LPEIFNGDIKLFICGIGHAPPLAQQGLEGRGAPAAVLFGIAEKSWG